MTAIIDDTYAEAFEEVHQISKKYINRNKFVTAFGGEHSITPGCIAPFVNIKIFVFYILMLMQI